MEAADESLLYLSVLTLGEIRKGVAGLPTRQAPDAPGELAGIGTASALFGENFVHRQGSRRSLGSARGLLAATALHYGLTLVSRNISDFASTQVPVLNPWEP